MRKVKYGLITLLPIAFVVKVLFAQMPTVTEALYSTKINKLFIEIVSKITGVFPFSLHEVGIYLLILLTVLYVVLTIRKMVIHKRNVKTTLYDALLTIFVCVSLFFFFFTVNWGVNYGRVPFEDTIGLEVKNRSVEELGKVYSILVEKTNELRIEVDVDKEGVMTVPGGYKSILTRAQKGYDAVATTYPTLSGRYGHPKPILASEWMNYTGITGVYSPFTGEANVNIAAPMMSIPFTTMHEMAHQRGYSSENEANFIGFLTSIAHPDVDFQYSGYLTALSYTRNALYENDLALFNKLDEQLSDEVRIDLRYKRTFWQKYEGPVSTVSDSVNHSFLKLNGVKDGVRSYGRMVDLLLAYYASVE